MPDVIEMLWKQIEPKVYITRAEFVRGLEDWEVEPVEVDGEIAFAILSRGPELHYAAFGTGKPASIAMIRPRISAILEEHGFVTTRTPIEGADRQHRINRKFGFVEVGRDEHFITYRMDKDYRQ